MYGSRMMPGKKNILSGGRHLISGGRHIIYLSAAWLIWAIFVSAHALLLEVTNQDSYTFTR